MTFYYFVPLNTPFTNCLFVSHNTGCSSKTCLVISLLLVCLLFCFSFFFVIFFSTNSFIVLTFEVIFRDLSKFFEYYMLSSYSCNFCAYSHAIQFYLKLFYLSFIFHYEMLLDNLSVYYVILLSYIKTFLSLLL